MRRPGVIVGIAVAILAVTLWRFSQPVPSSTLRLTQITFDTGRTTSPAISADGRVVAYASDRDSGNNLDLYVQQIQGGSPLRLTATPDDETEPDFSPDGGTLAFYSSKDGGGLYSIAVGGGETHLLAGGGRGPRYSPDGRLIAYRKGNAAAVVPSAGGAARPFHPEFAEAHPLGWLPDGGSIVFWGRQQQEAADLWLAPLDGGSAELVGLSARLAKAGLNPSLDDASSSAAGLLFSARTGFVRNLYRCPLDRRHRLGDILQLTNGTQLMDQPAASPDGRIVFASGLQRFDIWGLPLAADTGKTSGPPYRITDTLAPTANPSISRDGRKLLFGSSQNGFPQIWEKDLDTGAESVAATSPSGASYGLRTPSGRILYVQPSAANFDLYLRDPSTGQSRRLAGGARPWDVDPKEEFALVSGAGIDTVDLQSGSSTTLLRPPAHTALAQASFSADGRWILFVALTPPSARIYLAAYHGAHEIPVAEWLPVTDGKGAVNKPRFSLAGNLIYFTVDRSAGRAIQAVRFDPQTGRTAGQPFDVFDSTTPRLSLFEVNPAALEIGLARDRLVTIFGETTSTIWMADLVLN